MILGSFRYSPADGNKISEQSVLAVRPRQFTRSFAKRQRTRTTVRVASSGTPPTELVYKTAGRTCDLHYIICTGADWLLSSTRRGREISEFTFSIPRADSRAGGGACADRSWCRITALEPVRPHNESSLLGSFLTRDRTSSYYE